MEEGCCFGVPVTGGFVFVTVVVVADADVVALAIGVADAETDVSGEGGTVMFVGASVGVAVIAAVDADGAPLPGVFAVVPLNATTAITPTTIAPAASATTMPMFRFGSGAGVDCVVSRDAPRSVEAARSCGLIIRVRLTIPGPVTAGAGGGCDP